MSRPSRETFSVLLKQNFIIPNEVYHKSEPSKSSSSFTSWWRELRPTLLINVPHGVSCFDIIAVNQSKLKMADIGVFEILGTVALLVLAVVVVLLFVLVGWYVVWKLILSHFRFFREILGMENSDEELDEQPGKKSRMKSERIAKPESSSEIPAHIRRRQQREAEILNRERESLSIAKTAEKN
ncbi:hypothetical protein BV898_15934 [Hypsibius exemplaris]|uniref:Uncharacterized protein n=1 Tax=Hypsibius exemplaris TaxID=2072580 RepID=A0A9X6RKQ3_HYPEX|nr:hypothetical protein BV898_15934 [Hypsibius exemplaris]